LASIYGWGDAINKSVFTPPELRRGFAKLVAAGYVVDYDGRFGITETGRDLLSRAGYPATSALEAWRRLELLMKATRDPAGSAGLNDPVWPYPSVTDAVAREAEDEYRRWFAAEVRHLRGEP
jgi:hypothetical protein